MSFFASSAVSRIVNLRCGNPIPGDPIKHKREVPFGNADSPRNNVDIRCTDAISARMKRRPIGATLLALIGLLPCGLYSQSQVASTHAAAPQGSMAPYVRMHPSPESSSPPAAWQPLPNAPSAQASTESAVLLPLVATGFSSSSGQNATDSSKTQDHQTPQSKGKQSSPSATTGSPGHIFWVEPAYKVDYNGKFQPLTPKEKFHEWAQGAYDPLGFGVTAFEAGTLEYSSTDGFCGYGHGWDGYGKCFGSLELDSTVSSFIGDYALTVLWHQDPRYFRLGKGSVGKRLYYAISRVFVTYNDQGNTVFSSASLSGTVIAGAVSNLYYPSQDVGVSHTVNRIALDLGNTAIFNNAAEFWPDIHRGLRRMF